MVGMGLSLGTASADAPKTCACRRHKIKRSEGIAASDDEII